MQLLHRNHFINSVNQLDFGFGAVLLFFPVCTVLAAVCTASDHSLLQRPKENKQNYGWRNKHNLPAGQTKVTGRQHRAGHLHEMMHLQHFLNDGQATKRRHWRVTADAPHARNTNMLQ